MKNYLLFDLDGTLTDSRLGITTCVQYALSHFGIEEPELSKLEKFIGPPLKDSFVDFYGFDDKQAEEAVAKYRERYKDIGIFENEVYPGIPKMLSELKQKGMHLAVASSKPEVFVKRILEHFDLAQYFEVIVGSELDGRRVNKDEVVGEAFSRLFKGKAIDRDAIYMIGDRKFDVEGAKRHGIESVAVTFGFGDLEELKEAGADYIVQTVDELRRFLLRDVRQLEYEKQQQATPSQKIWAIAYPILMFIVVRTIATYFLAAACQFIGDCMINDLTRWMFIIDGAGTITGYTGNAGTIMAAIAYIAAAVSIRKRAKRSIERTYELNRLSHLFYEKLSTIFTAIVVIISTVIGLNLLIALSGIASLSESYTQVARDQYSANIIVGLICYGLITPICEELLFRGIVYNILHRFLSVKLAILVSAFLFGAYHMNSIQGMYAFLMGLILAYLYEYFGSFKAPVGAHMLANIVAYTMSYTVLATRHSIDLPVCLIALAICAAGIVLLMKRKRVL